MAGIPLINVSQQYSARYREVIAMMDDDKERAVALLEEMASEPFVPIFWVMMFNVSLCYRKSAEDAWTHYERAREAFNEIERRWSNPEGVLLEVMDRQRRNLNMLGQELPGLMEAQRQRRVAAAEQHQESASTDIAVESADETADELAETEFPDTAPQQQPSDTIEQDTQLMYHANVQTPVQQLPRTPLTLRRRRSEQSDDDMFGSPLQRRKTDG